MLASLRANGACQCAPDDRLHDAIQTPSFRDGPQDQTSDVQLHIGESRDSGFDASHRPGMTKSGLLRRFAPRNDVKSQFQTHVRTLAAQCARGFDESSAQRGRGERRMPVAPAASCALLLVERTRVTTSTPESPGIPARNGFNGFLRALPGDRALLPPSPSGLSLV